MGHHLLRFSLLFFFSSQIFAAGLPEPHHPPGWNLESFLSAVETPSVYRQIAIVEELLSGNYPASRLSLMPVIMEGLVQGQKIAIEIKVTEDYLRLGSDQESMVIPLTNYAAQYLADQWEFLLPNKIMADEIWNQSDVQLSPQPTDWYKVPGKMRKASLYKVFEERVAGQLGDNRGLISGHRKDVVITNRLTQKPNRVAIYGWHRQNGQPIQSLSLVHDLEYEDYSHGVRLISRIAKVTHLETGEQIERDLADLLTDPSYVDVFGETIKDLRAAHQTPKAFSDHF